MTPNRVNVYLFYYTIYNMVMLLRYVDSKENVKSVDYNTLPGRHSFYKVHCAFANNQLKWADHDHMLQSGDSH